MTDLGTWKVDTRLPLSNVAHLVNTLDVSKEAEGWRNIQLYNEGLGVAEDTSEARMAGALGRGLDAQVRKTYLWIARTWQENDEIYLFGFSRGAYVIRVVAGLICRFGLLSIGGFTLYKELYEAYHSGVANWEGQVQFQEFRRPEVKIKFVGVWDTVGTFGVPRIYLFGLRIFPFKWPSRSAPRFNIEDFHDHVEFGFHASDP